MPSGDLNRLPRSKLAAVRERAIDPGEMIGFASSFAALKKDVNLRLQLIFLGLGSVSASLHSSHG